ncbi:MAG: MFS transporter [Pseudohongiella sp.]|nr:MFS transporter [Pseudohongiella sp.]
MISSVIRVSTLLIGVAFLLTGHGLQLALIPLRAELFEWSSLALGVLGSAYFAGFLLGCFSIPRLVSRIGHVRCFATLSALLTASILALALLETFALWFVLRFIAGIAISGLYLVIESWLNEMAENDVRGGVLGIYTAIVLVALAIGQLLLNVAPLEGDKLFIIAASLIALAGIPICVTRAAQPVQIPSATFSPLLIVDTSRAAAVSALIAGMVTSVYYAMGPAWGLQVGMEIRDISSMMALGIIGGAVTLLPLGRFSDRRDRRLVILTIMLLGAVFAVFAAFAPVTIAPYLMFVFGGCIMPIQALSLAHASDNIENRSFLEVGTGLLVMNASGAIVGPLVAALAMQSFGSRAFFLFNAVVLAFGGLLVLVMIRSRNPTREHFAKFQVMTTATAQGALQLDPRTDPETQQEQDPLQQNQ